MNNDYSNKYYLSDPPNKDGNALFTTIPLKELCLIKYESVMHFHVYFPL